MNKCTGTDVSENTFNVRFPADGSDICFDYDTENIEKAAGIFPEAGAELTVTEAAGGCETEPASGLRAAGLPVAAVSPKRVGDFAEAAGQTAETDKTDARVIAGSGATLQPPPGEAADETTRKIGALTVRKRQLGDIRTAEKNRTEHIRDDFAEESILTVIAAVEKQTGEAD